MEKSYKFVPAPRVASLRGNRARGKAFTLIELLVVIAIIAILAAILMPVLSAAKQRALSIECLNNLKEIQLAWHLYTDENNDQIPRNVADDTPAFTESATQANAQPGQPNASWVLGSADSSPYWTNNLLLTHGLIYPYVNNVLAYKCPADPTPRNRNYSMSCWMNGTQQWDSVCINFTKTTQFVTKMDFTKVYVFLDENPASINDGYFAEDPANNATKWIDSPAHYHIKGGNLSFADGHCENRRWSDNAIISGADNGANGFAPQQSPPVDLSWIQARATVRVPPP